MRARMQATIDAEQGKSAPLVRNGVVVDHPRQGSRLGAAGPQRRREQRRYCHTSVIVVDSVDPDALRRWRKPPAWAPSPRRDSRARRAAG